MIKSRYQSTKFKNKKTEDKIVKQMFSSLRISIKYHIKSNQFKLLAILTKKEKEDTKKWQTSSSS